MCCHIDQAIANMGGTPLTQKSQIQDLELTDFYVGTQKSYNFWLEIFSLEVFSRRIVYNCYFIQKPPKPGILLFWAVRLGGTTSVFAHIVIIASSGADKGQIIEFFNITGGFQLLFLLFISLMTLFRFIFICVCICAYVNVSAVYAISRWVSIEAGSGVIGCLMWVLGSKLGSSGEVLYFTLIHLSP